MVQLEIGNIWKNDPISAISFLLCVYHDAENNSSLQYNMKKQGGTESRKAESRQRRRVDALHLR